MNRYFSVDIATTLLFEQQRNRGSILGSGKRFFSLRHIIHTGSGAQQASCLICTGDVSLEVKRPEREADHSPPSSAVVNNAWNGPLFFIRLHNMGLN
jgi:hypothetical protein